jgi:hypothetical protein
MQKRKRGAIELSINTIVIVVIGITLLTLGLKWITNLMEGTISQTENLQKITESEIIELFENSEKSISTVSKQYSIKQGKTLSSLEVYIRNNVQPGGAYSFSYIIKPLAYPPSISPEKILAQMSWYDQEIPMQSGEGYSDTIIFNTRELPIGTYKFETDLTCNSPNCHPADPKYQFIITIN